MPTTENSRGLTVPIIPSARSFLTRSTRLYTLFFARQHLYDPLTYSVPQAREDARLFEDFCDRIEAKQPKMEGKVGVEEDKAPKEKDKLPEKENEATKPERIEEAIKAAARLSAEIRDIRDELQMLQAIAKHQTRVQKEMKNESSADFKLWENYVMSDIADMIESADRIKSNVR